MAVYLSLPILGELVQFVENDSTYEDSVKAMAIRSHQNKTETTIMQSSSFFVSIVDSLETEVSLITHLPKRNAQVIAYRRR